VSEQLIVFGVRPDPEPHQIALVFHGNCPVMKSDSDGPQTTDFLEVQ